MTNKKVDPQDLIGRRVKFSTAGKKSNVSVTDTKQKKAQTGRFKQTDIGILDTVTGKVTSSTGKGKKKLSVAQGDAKLFADRIQNSLKVLEGLQDVGFDLSTGTGFDKFIPERQRGQKRRKLEQLKLDILGAILRKESGAKIDETEVERGNKQYFPQVGDGPEVIQQKLDNIRTVLNGLREIAGDEPLDFGERKTPEITEPSPQTPSQNVGALGALDLQTDRFIQTFGRPPNQEELSQIRNSLQL